MDFSCYNNTSFILTSANTEQENAGPLCGRDLPDLSLDKCDMFSNGGQGLLCESMQRSPNEVDPHTKFSYMSSSRNRAPVEPKFLISKISKHYAPNRGQLEHRKKQNYVSSPNDLPFAPILALTADNTNSPLESIKVGSHSSSCFDKHVPKELFLSSSDKSILPASTDANIWLSPGNIVWAKASCHGWWPAEVMDVIALMDYDYLHTARVLVQLFESHESEWVDASDLSQLSDCFEERSKNPSVAFQNALKQALCKYGNGSLRASPDRCIGEMGSSTQHDKSRDASKSSVFSNIKDDHDEGRGKRKRKMKIHFDEISVSDNPARKIRRLKIMRLLGLAAPVGSPFSYTHKSS